MIVFGIIFIIKPPKTINTIYGYRTDMSMKNKETWAFAHNYCGKIWFVIGLIILMPSIIAMIFIFGKDIIELSVFGLIICLIQTVVMVIPLIPTEIALRKNFDSYGNRKK